MWRWIGAARFQSKRMTSSHVWWQKQYLCNELYLFVLFVFALLIFCRKNMFEQNILIQFKHSVILFPLCLGNTAHTWTNAFLKPHFKWWFTNTGEPLACKCHGPKCCGRPSLCYWMNAGNTSSRLCLIKVMALEFPVLLPLPETCLLHKLCYAVLILALLSLKRVHTADITTTLQMCSSDLQLSLRHLRLSFTTCFAK